MPKLSDNKGAVNRRITNLKEYLHLKDVRAMTGLIGGKIYYNGKFWDEETYNQTFPEPKLVYDVEQLDGRQIEK